MSGTKMKSSPAKAGPSKYKKTSGAADMSGELYETKMATLLFLRGLNSEKEFQISSNMEAAGSFDDIVFTLGHRTAFLQLKHKQKKDATIIMPHLFTSKDFSLFKYCSSYLETKRNWQSNDDLQSCGRFEDSLFIIFTNANLAANVGSTVGSSEMHALLNTHEESKLIQFTEQQHIYSVFENLPRYKKILSEIVNGGQVPDTPEMLEVVRIFLNNKAKGVPDKNALVKLFTDINSLGDMSGYEEFLSQLYFYTEQTGENKLDELIKSELVILFGNDANFLELKLGVEDWWRTSYVYLTAYADFFQNIIQKTAGNITKNISKLNVKFVENQCNNIKQNLTSDTRILHVYTECTNLTSVKVLQSFQNSLLVDVSTLQTRLPEVLAVWRLWVCDVLVVEGDITDISILQQFDKMPDSKSIVVISDNKQTQLYQQFKFVSLTDTFCLSQLVSDSQHEILERKVTFQGFPVKLNLLADVSFLESADILVQLFHAMEIGNKLDDLDYCYIPRTFLRKEYVSEQIFGEQKIILAVTGLSESKLAQLVPSGKKVKKFDRNSFTRDEICRYFLIESEPEFTALCRVHDNIHWIEVCEENFMWKKSKGDMSPITKNLKNKFQSYDGVEKVLELPNQVVLVVAESGMGKSTEMSNIAHTVKQKDPSTWVLRTDLADHVSLLSQNDVRAMEFLEEVASLNTTFAKSLFQHQLQSSGNIVILLDAFDWISPNYSGKVFSLLKQLLETRIVKIFVFSRPNILEKLQQEFSTLAFSFQAFTRGDQEKFLASYWNKLHRESLTLSNFIRALLHLLKTFLSDNDELKQITGIPLHCKILAEVFQDKVSNYCEAGGVSLPQSLNVLQLLNKFVDNKWEVYCKKFYGDMKNAMLLSQIQIHKVKFLQSRMCCALVSCLQDDQIKTLENSQNVLKQHQDFVQDFNSGNEKTGIVTAVVNNKAVFLHQTFAEYFVAMWYSENFHLELKSVQNIYFNRNFITVQKFLDQMLAQKFELHTAILNKELYKIKDFLSEENCKVNEKDEGGRTALHLAIINYYYNMEDNVNQSVVEILLEHGADVNCEDNVFHWKPIQLAKEIRAWPVVKLLDKKEEQKNKEAEPNSGSDN